MRRRDRVTEDIVRRVELQNSRPDRWRNQAERPDYERQDIRPDYERSQTEDAQAEERGGRR